MKMIFDIFTMSKLQLQCLVVHSLIFVNLLTYIDLLYSKRFTTMGLPRSVKEMSHDDFKPRRCQSGAFRGFSFIHDDFVLPDRSVSL